MKKYGLFLSLLVILSLVTGLLLAGCSSADTPKLKVVTSTSLMQYIAEQVGGDLVEVINLVPPNQHPGNFDVKPSDIQNLAKAKLFLLHGWPGEGYADKLVESANNPSLVVVKAGVNGNWMIPSVQAQAVDKVAQVLSENDAVNAAVYQKNAEAYKKKITDTEAEIKTLLKDVAGVKVIASARQADFLTWAGLEAVAAFNSPQELTPQKVQELVDAGKKANVSMIVNNLQDSKDAGKAIAQELGIKEANLSNFPGGFPDTETWEKAIKYNIDIILLTLNKK